MAATGSRTLVFCAAAAIALLVAAYANHFDNGFHFDDSHAIVDNAFIRDIRNIPTFFTDATTFSVLPLNQSYRPVLQATLAVDYWMAGGYYPRIFQADSFLWFVILLVCTYGLFVCLIRPSAGEADPRIIALAATTAFGLHPVCAETVNYVIQRGEILSTLGVVAALWIDAAGRKETEAPFREAPVEKKTRFPFWIVPAVFGALAKPPALIFPALIACYILVVERPGLGERRARWRDLGLAVTVTVACGWWMAAHTPPTYTTGAASPTAYWLSQPYVSLRYFASFFAPVSLSADNDWAEVSGIGDPMAIAGLVFVAAVLYFAWLCGRSREARPIAFGLWWFLLALVPTSATPLAEIANDHRMFFPFVGLSLAVTWVSWLIVRRLSPPVMWQVVLPLTLVVLGAETVGVRARNNVWRTDESLWLDVIKKSPANGRGLMNYGLARMEKGDFAAAIDHFERGLRLAPNYSLLHVNLGIAYGAIGRAADAERAFRRAAEIAPTDWRVHFFFARWLSAVGRADEALLEATLAATQNPLDDASRDLAARLSAGRTLNADGYVALSLAQYRAGKFRESIASARQALALRPDYAEAFNNIAAGHNALGEWDLGIAAAEQAVRLNPNLQIARNNLAYALAEKGKGATPQGRRP